MKKRVRLALGLLFIAATIVVFALYLKGHTDLLRELRHIPLTTVIWLLVLYGAWLGALVLILQAALYICRRTVSVEENILLNAYSTLTNFFVPGQGGIALRGVYLKKQHNLKVRDYVTSMLLYYACYAVVSAFMLLTPSRPWWQSAIGVLVVAGGVVAGVRWYMKRLKSQKDGLNLQLPSFVYLLVATVVQAIIQVVIYFVELQSVNHSISLGQVITYTGAANFALFVALTPGAIGIRETFLVFSQRLHHISTANIVDASIIDRAIFLVFLGLLFVLTLTLHAKNKLQVGKTAAVQDEFKAPDVSERKE
jgi:uncharacterized membrane protein YbhN (UPF0104 family)